MTAWTLPPGRWCLPEYHASMASPFTLVTCSSRRSVLNSLPSRITKGCLLPGPLQGLVQVRGLAAALGPSSTYRYAVAREMPWSRPSCSTRVRSRNRRRTMTACSRQVSARLPAGVHRLRRSRISSRVTKRSSSMGTSSVARQVITWSPRAEDDLR